MALLQMLLEFGFLFSTSKSFNLEISQAIIYEPPDDGDRGSYFGMSVSIRPGAASFNGTWSIQIGAPKGVGATAQSGTVFRCLSRGPCGRSAPDEGLAASGGRGVGEFREKKDAAWIGVAMGVGRFGPYEISVVCGHRWMNQNRKNPENIDVTYLMTGVCYLQNLLKDTSETPVQRLLPLANKDKIYTPKPYVVDLSTYHWGLGQAGISVDLVEDPPQILIGAPGVTHWTGSVVRYEENLRISVASFARTEMVRRSRYPYLGYSVASGRFYKDREFWYVAGAPRSANYRGEVFTFQFKASSDDVRVQSNFAGATFGEYFGSSLATVDLNSDGFDDLIVGAPLFSSKEPDEGRIYVYLGTGKGNFLVPAQVINGRMSQGRFGSCIASLKDLDQDGYGDVAVGAPYEDDNRGAIYVYRGYSKGLQADWSQRIRAQDLHPHLRGFGISVSPAVDVDGNNYVDIAVGSYLSGHVVLIRSRPVISLHPIIRTENSSLIDRRDFHFNMTVCSRFAGSNAPDYVDIVRTIDVDPLYGRGKLDPKKSAHRKSIRLRRNEMNCERHTVMLDVARKNFSPLHISVRNEIAPCLRSKESFSVVEEATGAQEFQKICPVGNKAEASKEISFAGICGPDFTCHSDLELSCAVPHFRGGFYTLGSTEFLELSVEVKNHEEPAQETKIKISSNLKLKRRDSESSWEDSRRIHWLNYNNIVIENFKTNFLFQIDSGASTESGEETHLNLTVEIFTSSIETNLENNNCKFAVTLLSDARLNFDASSSVASVYIQKTTPREPTLNVTHFYEVQKTGVTPLSDVELTIYIPIYFKKEFLTFEVETAEWMHFSRDSEKKTLSEFREDGFEQEISNEKCPPTNRTLFLNCSTAGNECDVLRIFFTKGIPVGLSSYVKILITLNITATDLIKTEKNIVYVSTTGVLKFSNFLERKPTELRKSASISLYSEEEESHLDAHVVALSILAGGLLLSLIVTGLVKNNFFRRARKQELKALRDAGASFVYFPTVENVEVI